MLTLHFADAHASALANTCPMSDAVGFNFVSQLRTPSISFSEHVGPLSIKCAFGGKELYEVERGRFEIDEGSYLVLNNGQRYASSIQSESAIESFCIWFRPGFAEQILAGLRTPADRLLDDPGVVARQPVLFFERLSPHDDLVSPVLRRIHTAAEGGWITRDWLDEQFHVLLERLLQAHRNVYHEIERLPAVRWSTRVELYRRLYRARDFLDASLESNVTLHETAGVACLSPHHFLRLFKQVFHETPHQYRGRKRMERARKLLVTTDQSVTQICYDLGFESLGSFSWLFRRRFGVSPTQCRQFRGRPERYAAEESNFREAGIYADS